MLSCVFAVVEGVVYEEAEPIGDFGEEYLVTALFWESGDGGE